MRAFSGDVGGAEGELLAFSIHTKSNPGYSFFFPDFQALSHLRPPQLTAGVTAKGTVYLSPALDLRKASTMGSSALRSYPTLNR